MKTLIFILIPIFCIGQRVATIEKWEIKTSNGGYVIGAELTPEDAKEVLKEFKNRNKNKKYSAKLENITTQTVKIIKRSDSPLDKLHKYSNKRYFILSKKQHDLFIKYNWKYHPELVFSYSVLTGKDFSVTQEFVKAVLRYKIKGSQKWVVSN